MGALGAKVYHHANGANGMLLRERVEGCLS
jgi:hypothetical protein